MSSCSEQKQLFIGFGILVLFVFSDHKAADFPTAAIFKVKRSFVPARGHAFFHLLAAFNALTPHSALCVALMALLPIAALGCLNPAFPTAQ
jgi:hypothetical protein